MERGWACLLLLKKVNQIKIFILYKQNEGNLAIHPTLEG